jgi:hypothetical protein
MPKWKVAAAEVARHDGLGLLDPGHGAGGEVGGAADELGHDLRQRVDDLAGGGTGGQRLVDVEDRQGGLELLGQLAAGVAAPGDGLLGMARGPLLEVALPARWRGPVHGGGAGGEEGADLFRHEEGAVLVEAQGALGQAHLLLAQRRAVARGRAGSCWGCPCR